MKTRKVSEHLKEELKDAYFKELYELEEQKYSIIKVIINYRIKNNLNQTELADRMGVTQQFISKIENGEFSSFSTLAKVMLNIGYAVKIEPVALTPSRKNKIRELMAAKIKSSKSPYVRVTKKVGTRKIGRSAITGRSVKRS